MKEFSEMRELISQASIVALIGHIQPDGDCIGTVLALRRLLQQQGKQVFILSEDPIPEQFAFLEGADQYIMAADIVPDDDSDEQSRHRADVLCRAISACDLLITVDISDPRRLGDHFQWLLSGKRIINFDHHLSNTRFGNLNLVSDISSTGELLLHYFEFIGIKPDLKTAECLYTSIMTDTGNFCYSNTTASTHRAAADLIECGVDVAYINQNIYEQQPLANIHLLSRILSHLQLSECGRVAWISVSREELAEEGASDQNISSFINYPRSIAGVEIGIFFKEKDDGDIKISFRSKHINVSNLAAQFGGGGHKKAAGCQVTGNLIDVMNDVVAAAVKKCDNEL